MPLGELQQRLGHATITMTMRYAVYQPPVASVHYDRALADMGLDDEHSRAAPVPAMRATRIDPSAALRAE